MIVAVLTSAGSREREAWEIHRSTSSAAASTVSLRRRCPGPAASQEQGGVKIRGAAVKMS
jgi:hypothetical protein